MLTFLKVLSARIRAFFRPQDLDRDFGQELESHLSMLAEENVRRGMTPEQARREAQLKLGGFTQLREAHREIRSLAVLEAILQDAQYALRAMRKSPGFTAVAVLTLAIDMGVNTAVFTAYNALLLQPIRVPEPSRLLLITHSAGGKNFAYPDYTYYRDNNRAFSGIVAIALRTFALTGDATAVPRSPAGIAGAAGVQVPQQLLSSEQVMTGMVSGNYFQVLGVGAALGRTLLPEENTSGAQPVALVSDNFWERRFARDPGLLGRTLTLGGVDVTVVGITPHDFSGTSPLVPDIWVPLAPMSRLARNIDLLHDQSDCCRVYGRLQKGIMKGQAKAEMNTLGTRLQSGLPGASGRPRQTDRFALSQASLMGEGESTAQRVFILGALQGVIGLVLLIACANVATLLLARSAARHREIATRLAIGASRGRLVRQLLTEGTVMSLLAAGVGTVLSWWSLNLLIVRIAPAMPGTMALHVAPDQRVVLFILVLSIGATIAFGLAPALETSKPNLTSALKDEGAAFGGGLRKSRLRDLMIGTQVAVCLVLLIAAGLLTRSSQRALEIDAGFNYHGIISMDVDYPRTMSPGKVAALQSQVAQQMEALPEIQSVAIADRPPLAGGLRGIAVASKGEALNNPGAPRSLFNQVTSHYFDTVGIPILRGRTFIVHESRDGSNFDGSPVIVSEAAAKRFWPGQDPIGQRFAFGACLGCRILPAGEEYPHSVSSVVIGVAKDVRSQRLDSLDGSLLYLPVTRRSSGIIVMRARGDEGKALTAIQREFRAVRDSRTAITSQSGFVLSRAGAIGSTIIGILGLLMASVGIYGTVGFAVTQRRQEIGIRMALGARRWDVLRLVLSETMRPVAIGLTIGVAGAAMVSHLMSSFLFGLSPLDPVAFLGIPSFLTAVALLAGYVPARRATRVDPMIALRYG